MLGLFCHWCKAELFNETEMILPDKKFCSKKCEEEWKECMDDLALWDEIDADSDYREDKR